MLNAIQETAIGTAQDINAIRSLMETALLQIQQTLGKTVPAERLRDLAFRQAYVKIELLEIEQIAKRQTASKYLHALTLEGGGPDLFRVERRGREVYFKNHKLLNILS